MTLDDHWNTMQEVATIAIVEDNLLIAQVLSEMLSDEGYAVRIYRDGRSAVTALIAQPPALVLLDLELPAMTGEQVLSVLRGQLGAALPIIIMTASTQRRDWMALGATSFLAKPFEMHDLLACVARYVVRGDELTL
jgi:two-component system response regulator ChvI